MHDLAQRSFAWERVRDVLASGPPGFPLDPEPEQIEAVIDMGDRCLLWRERQAHLLRHELGRLLLDLMGLGFGAADQHHEVVREADHSIAGVAPGPVTRALVVRACCPCRLEVAVEYREGNVRQKGRETRPLWRARWRRGHAAKLAHDTGGEEQPDQSQDALVGHPTAHLVHQEALMDLPEAVLDVSLYHPLIQPRGVDEEPHLLDGVLGSASGPESVRGRAEVRLEDRLEYQLGCRLHDPVAQRGDAGSGRGAVPALPPVRFPDPPAEPDLPIPEHPALHRTCDGRS